MDNGEPQSAEVEEQIEHGCSSDTSEDPESRIKSKAKKKAEAKLKYPDPSPLPHPLNTWRHELKQMWLNPAAEKQTQIHDFMQVSVIKTTITIINKNNMRHFMHAQKYGICWHVACI